MAIDIVQDLLSARTINGDCLVCHFQQVIHSFFINYGARWTTIIIVLSLFSIFMISDWSSQWFIPFKVAI